MILMGFLGGLDDKESSCNAGDPGSTPGLGRSPGKGNVYPLQHSCLVNSMNRGAWWATVHGVSKSRTLLINTFTWNVFYIVYYSNTSIIYIYMHIYMCM